ncbi:fumarylacetoacetate hydrolase family protein [Brachyspira pilosicoli]|uniref:fumarylacetoacetate hydrolase family protein n=1 Tax=Brachyspira pilosicoli TaxID=52584 RepID=UPI000C771971|nr:fumarylacetoacetate hydrolase family protein [Brachyspira pilosicoli]PLV64230.1 hydrolase [Brachyspira pilosicoli SP16]WIH80483.1 fumarylacetoacetate hydrolase family protein [Brachyspira pilosicoli]
MKFVSYLEWNNTEAIGILTKNEQNVIPIADIIPEFKNYNMINFIENCNKEILNKLEKEIDTFKQTYSIEKLQLLSPITKPIHDIICVGVNYQDHINEVKNNINDVQNTKPVYFSKRAIYIIGHNHNINARLDLDEALDYEAELAIIIGKKAKDIKIEEVNEYIFGYSIFNDISSRKIQKEHSQWYKGKSLDTYSSMGPCIVYKDDIKDVNNLNIKSTLNDEIRQNSNTKHMIHNIYELVSDISKGMTLEPGDIIATGTPSGVGMGFNPPKYMKNGDKITCSIENIGELTNYVK